MYEHGGDSYRYPDFTDFSANINLLGAPECAVERARAALDGITHYPQVGCDRLRQAIAELEQAEPQEIICGNGAAEVIFSLVLALKPRKAMVFAPAFQEYEQALKSVDCQVIREYLSPEQGFRITEHSLAQADDTIDMVFVCNPNNPTGRLIPPALLERIFEICRKRKIRLFVDECFLELSDGGREASLAGRLLEYPGLFLLKAFTKSYGMAGLRLGYCLSGDRALLAEMSRRGQPWNVSLPAQAAGVAALRETAFLEEARELIARERPRLAAELKKLGFRVCPSQANYLLFYSRTELCAPLLERGVLIRNCSNYAGLEAGWYRAAVRKPEENRRLLEVLEEILAQAADGKNADSYGGAPWQRIS